MLIAITRPVSSSINQCNLTHLTRSPIDLESAITQHSQYEDCLQRLGCDVHRLPALHEQPDAVFVEDTCIVFDELAVITRPAAVSRQGETDSVAERMKDFRALRYIEPPGTLDGGDVLVIGHDIYVGRSTRSNSTAIEQLSSLVMPFGYRVTAVDITGCLHLKSAATVVAEQTIVANPMWVDPKVFRETTTIVIDPSEPAAANALRVGGKVVYPTTFPKTQQRLWDHGVDVENVNLSELAKAEGAVTCCSLVFET